MKFNDGKTISAYVRSKLHSGYITQCSDKAQTQKNTIDLDLACLDFLKSAIKQFPKIKTKRFKTNPVSINFTDKDSLLSGWDSSVGRASGFGPPGPEFESCLCQ